MPDQDFDDLVDTALEEAMSAIVLGEAFTLQGVCQAPDGEWHHVTVTAPHGPEIFAQARAHVAETQATAFAFAGPRSSVDTQGETVDLMTVYAKAPDDEAVSYSFAPFVRMDEEGQVAFELGDWYDDEKDYRAEFIG
jgi:hypothetical protein